MVASPQDLQWMAKAIRLAKLGIYGTDPNPNVGCVIVKDNQCIGEGWHQKAGKAHAEVNALVNAAKTNEDIQGAVVYVTLEPCAHHGKTPPCVDTLIKAKISRVCIAMQDPNPLVAGKSITRLQEAGIAVEVGLLESEARKLNQGFIQRMEGQRPWVRMKSAMSFDGRTAMASGESKWITGEAARKDVQKLRAKSSVILTGVGTVIADNPAMTVRDLGGVEITRQPMRVIIDTQLRIPVDAKILKDNAKVVIFTNETNTEKHKKILAKHITIVAFEDTAEMVNLEKILDWLATQEVNEVLVEAGATLSASFMKQKLVDEMIVYVAPKLMGAAAKPLFDFKIDNMESAIDLNIIQVRMVGEDIRYICEIL